MTHLAGVLKIRPGEGRMAMLLIGVMLFTSAGGSIGGNGIEALFFARFGVQFLPYMYVALGVTTLVTSLTITALLGRVARERLYVSLPLALALLLIGERALLSLDQKWIYPVLWLGMNVKGSLQGLLTWGLAGMACDTRQAKRLFPLFSAGGILGAVVGGLGTRPLADWLHSENLLLVWAGALLLAVFISRALIGRSTAPAARSPVRRKRTPIIDEMQQGYRFVRGLPLLRWMSAAAVLFAVLFFSLALPFSRAAAQQFPAEDALAGFFGLFQALSTGVAFLVSLFLANRLFARFGVMRMMLVLPLIYLAGFGALAAYAAFPALVVFRFIQNAYLSGIAGTAYQAVFNVVPAERRDQTRAFIDGVPGQAGIVIAGLVLLIGEQALQPQQLYFIGLGAAVLTTMVVWQAMGAYGGALAAALRAGQPLVFSSEEEPFGGFQRDAGAVAAIVAGLSSPDPAIRRVSAEILGGLPAPEAAPALMSALADADAQVRAASLRALAQARATPALLEVTVCLADPESEVRMQAVETLRRLAGGARGLSAHLRPLLADPAPTVRARAALALLRASPDSQTQTMLTDMAAMGEAEARVSAIAALGEWGAAAGFEPVVSGLRDPAPIIRRAAASALAKMDAEGATEHLIRALGDEEASVREAAAHALGRTGASALGLALAALSDPALESGALLALEHLPARQAAPKILDYARQSVARALYYAELSRGIEPQLPGGDRVQLLTASLRGKALFHGLNALRALGLLGNHDALALAIENLQSRDPGQRANALETLESVGERQIVRPLLRLWEAAEAAPAQADGLLRVMQDSDAWLRACAALAAGGVFDPPVRSALAQLAQSDSDATVREAAASALNGDSAMNTLAALSLMERILFLRRVPLFADLSPADLKRVGALALERTFADGDVIARQGDMGDEMYVIISGEIRVLTSAGVELARRKPGEYVGEMAIISREPRMASLAAAGGGRLLCLDQKHFEGLLRERPETSLALMRVLCERLREAVEEKVRIK